MRSPAFLAVLVLSGCIRDAGQFDPPPGAPRYAAPVIPSRSAPVRRPDCEEERIDVHVGRRPDGSLVWPAGTISTGGWEGEDFAAVTFWVTLRGARVCDPTHEVGIWDEYKLGWRRPFKGDRLD